MEIPRQPRYEQLDSLRGIGVLMVVFGHFTLLAPLIFLRKTPLRLLGSGHEAVLLFFILSGFVLTLQLNKKNPLSYSQYVVRRIWRLYFPYLAAVGIGVIVFSACFSGKVEWAGSWFNAPWPGTLGIADISNHLLFLGQFPTDRIVPVIWSLVYEMRISLIFPLVVSLLVRMPSALAFLIAMLGSGSVYAIFAATGTHAMDASISGDWLMTLHYLLMFVVGGMLAKHRHALVAHFDTTRRNVALLLVSLVLYFLSRALTINIHGTLNGFLYDWLAMLGAAGLIASTITFAPLARLLNVGPLMYLGRMSFSIYLFHTIVLLGVIHYVVAPPLVAIALAGILILPVCALAYRFIEQPTMRIGATLSRSDNPVGRTTKIV
ncbi:MAG: acyltransferase family protein [Janthinobacterium lividum]